VDNIPYEVTGTIAFTSLTTQLLVQLVTVQVNKLNLGILGEHS
jgi:hypothetical protein